MPHRRQREHDSAIKHAPAHHAHREFGSDRTFSLPVRNMTRDAIVSFARRYDPQPFHLDERAARRTILRGLSASGWHTCSVFMSAVREAVLPQFPNPRLYAVDEIKWLHPVRPGDLLSGHVKARAMDVAAPWPGTGQVELDCVATTSEGRRVMLWKARLAVAGYEQRAGATQEKAAPLPLRGIRPGTLAHFESVTVGDEVDLGEVVLSVAAIKEFNREFDLGADGDDADPIHANGWHVTAMFMNRLIRYYLREANALRRLDLPVPQLGPSPGVRNLHWHAPVAAGDRIRFRAWAERKAIIDPYSNWGLLVGRCAGVNQDDLPVVTFEAQLLLERRPPLAI